MNLVPREILREIFLYSGEINAISRVNHLWNKVAGSIERKIVMIRARKSLPIIKQFKDGVHFVKVLLSPKKQVLVHHFTECYFGQCEADLWVFSSVEYVDINKYIDTNQYIDIDMKRLKVFPSKHKNIKELLTYDYGKTNDEVNMILGSSLSSN